MTYIGSSMYVASTLRFLKIPFLVRVIMWIIGTSILGIVGSCAARYLVLTI